MQEVCECLRIRVCMCATFGDTRDPDMPLSDFLNSYDVCFICILTAFISCYLIILHFRFLIKVNQFDHVIFIFVLFEIITVTILVLN